MRHFAVLVAAAALGALLAAPSADAAQRPAIGIADQNSAMFFNPMYRKLPVARFSRVVVSYDALIRGKRHWEIPYIDHWLATARAQGIEPLLTLNHSRGCFVNGKRLKRKKRCKLPSVKRYDKAVRKFRKRYPWVRTWSPWNEINHLSQPTENRPDRAAAFYNVVRRRCRGCTIVAADVLDQPGVGRYLRRFRRHAIRGFGNPRLWGLHNYQDANDYTTDGTREALRAVPGKFWLTEVGGIVKLGKKRPFKPSRAAKATKYMFKLARRYRRVTRVYIYNWVGGRRNRIRFDSGLTTPAGRARPALKVVRKYLKRYPSGKPLGRLLPPTLLPAPSLPDGTPPEQPPPEQQPQQPPPNEPPPEPDCGALPCLDPPIL